MPILPENKDLSRGLAGDPEPDPDQGRDCCEGCGLPNHAWVNRKTRNLCLSDECDAIRIVCTTAHLDHNPAHNQDANLRFWCQKCHNTYDRKHRGQTILTRKMKGQLKLFQ